MSKQLVTTIRWRPYPEQKPPKGDVFFLARFLYGGIARLCYAADGIHFQEIGMRYEPQGITHFALPEDITTTEAP